MVDHIRNTLYTYFKLQKHFLLENVSILKAYSGFFFPFTYFFRRIEHFWLSASYDRLVRF